MLQEIHVPTGGRSIPSATNPVLVDIGPGNFNLTSTAYAYCNGVGYLTFQGAGKDVTILTGGGYPSPQDGFVDVFAPYAVLIKNCSNVEFSHLQIQTMAGVSKSAIRFTGAGETYWTSMNIEVPENDADSHPVLWLDAPINGTDTSKHYWSDVTAEVTSIHSPSGFWITGSNHEFRASHLRVASQGGIVYGAIFGSGAFNLNFVGSQAEIVDTGTTTELAVFWFTNGAGFYPSCSNAYANVSGSVFRASTTQTSGTGFASGIVNFCQGFAGSIVVRGTQFTVTGSGPLSRIGGNQPIDSPYSLGAGTNPPTVGTGWTAKGMDAFDQTDCGATCANTSQGSETHRLVFDPACATVGPWFDTVTRKCRGQ